MKINQQLCQKMDQLNDQDEGCKVCVRITYFWRAINQFEQLKLNEKISDITALKYYSSAQSPVSLSYCI